MFFSKNDPQDIRLGDLAQSVEQYHSTFSCALIGYPDDEGIKNNNGRTGANEAPDKVREFLYKMTPSMKNQSIADYGNLASSQSILEKHKLASEKVFAALSHERLLTLGGGHDYGYPDGAGFLKKYKNKKNVIINFDAHLDVRPDYNGINSGTPFYRLLRDFPNEFRFIEVGIQPQCNSPHHIEWLLQQGGEIIWLKDILKNGLWSILKNRLLDPIDHIFLSLDIDVFEQASAPGASQSWPIGLSPVDFYLAFEELLNHFHIPLLGIYEVSPPLDKDNRTSKLAAQIAHQFIHHARRAFHGN